MKNKSVMAIATIMTMATLAIPATSDPGPGDLLELLPADFSCENGSHDYTMVDPWAPPGTLVTIHIQCPGEIRTELDSDCTGTSWSHWVGPQKAPWSYTFDTANPFGFSSTAVASAWDASNREWETFTSPATNIYNGYSVQTVGAASGTYDQYVLAEFRYLSGQLRTAVGVQWAWQGTGADSGKIIHTDAAYNTRYAFSLTGAAGTYDLQSISSHEMGHGFGLGHASTAGSSACLTLYPYATLGATHGRTLGDGDIISIQNRY